MAKQELGRQGDKEIYLFNLVGKVGDNQKEFKKKNASWIEAGPCVIVSPTFERSSRAMKFNHRLQVSV